eukprot:Colp12_sorted_trinity150504_noHs@12831
MATFVSRLLSSRHAAALVAHKKLANSPSITPTFLSTIMPTLLLSLTHVRCMTTERRGASLSSRAAKFPEVLKQWHSEKNNIRPEDVAAYSDKKCWFLCDEGHEWQARLRSRTRLGQGCPTCNRRRATRSNCLLVKKPAVAEEWHHTKNGDLTAKDVSHASKRKVWWQCKEGHEWEAFVSARTILNGGCPQCYARLRGAPKGQQSFLAAHPDLAQHWHPTKNGLLTPEMVSRASGRKIWWQCSKDQTHEWEATTKNRSMGSSCPFCAKTGPRPLSEMNNLQALYPEVAHEWHPILNGELTPDKVAGKAMKKVWWACGKCRHEWQAIVQSRTARGVGCPQCAIQQRRKQ